MRTFVLTCVHACVRVCVCVRTCLRAHTRQDDVFHSRRGKHVFKNIYMHTYECKKQNNMPQQGKMMGLRASLILAAESEVDLEMWRKVL